MRCLTSERIQSFIDEELSISEVVAIEEHLHVCSICFATVEKQKKDHQKLLELVNFLVDDNTKIPIFSDAKRSANKRNKSIIKLSIYGGVAAVALLFVFRMFIFNDKEDSTLVYEQLKTKVPMEEIIIMENDFADGIDANKPFHQQEMTILLIDGNGRIIDKI